MVHMVHMVHKLYKHFSASGYNNISVDISVGDFQGGVADVQV